MLEYVGPRKLFTKEEKLMLNRRVPDLAAATSVSFGALDCWL